MYACTYTHTYTYMYTPTLTHLRTHPYTNTRTYTQVSFYINALQITTKLIPYTKTKLLQSAVSKQKLFWHLIPIINTFNAL